MDILGPHCQGHSQPIIGIPDQSSISPQQISQSYWPVSQPYWSVNLTMSSPQKPVSQLVKTCASWVRIEWNRCWGPSLQWSKLGLHNLLEIYCYHDITICEWSRGQFNSIRFNSRCFWPENTLTTSLTFIGINQILFHKRCLIVCCKPALCHLQMMKSSF